MSDRVAIILLNWKGAADTIACVESLLSLEQKDIGIYICDNASPDGSIEHLTNWAVKRLQDLNSLLKRRDEPTVVFRNLSEKATRGPETSMNPLFGRHITLIQTGANMGFAAGNNVGLRYALEEGYKYFWLLNNDTEVEPDALTALLDRVRADPSIGICGSTLIYHDQRDMVQNLGGGSFSRLKGYGKALGHGRRPTDPIDADAIEREMRFVSGASMLVTRSFLDRVGLMAEDYFLYYEELDWSFRSARQFKLGYASKSVVYHKVGASIGTEDFGNRSLLSEYYLAKSRLKFCARYTKRSLPFFYFDIGRQVVRHFFRRDWDRAAVLLNATFGMPMSRKQ